MAKTDTPASRRPRKSAAEKAQADLDAAIKTRDAARKKLEKVEPTVATLRAELQQSEQLVDYLSKNPLLQPAQSDEPETDLAAENDMVAAPSDEQG